MHKRIPVIALLYLIACPAWAQIPVTDAASLSQQTTAHMESMAKYVEQIQQLRAQVEQQRQQYLALTGARGLGTILNDPRVREYLPEEWQQVYDAVRAGDYGGLTQEARRIYDANHVYDTCDGLAADARQTCRAQAMKPAQDKAMVLAAYDRAKARLAQIEGLMGQINRTEDPKAIAEVQARINAEQAMVQTEQTKMQLYALITEAEDKLQAQRKHEAAMQEAAKTGRLQLQPINFGQPEMP